jgi:hypothetical protein
MATKRKFKSDAFEAIHSSESRELVKRGLGEPITHVFEKRS